MRIIIDANNLAGQLKMLGNKDFDQDLVLRFRKYAQPGKTEYVLVFDGRDTYGDKSSYERLTVIYSPRDKYYKDADDKIVELVSLNLKQNKDDLTLVTGDIELIKRCEQAAALNKRTLKILSCAAFAEKLIRIKKDETEEKQPLGKEAVAKLNQELMDLWVK